MDRSEDTTAALPTSLPPAKKPRWTRRQWIKLAFGSGLVGAVSVVGYSMAIEPHWLEFVERDMPIANLPAALEGKRLVQISDLHVGSIVSDAYLLRALRDVEALQPDILALTGDFITCDSTGNPPLDQAQRIYEKLPAARLGTVAVLGNHDYGLRWKARQIADRVAAMLQQQGCHILRNDSHVIAGLKIIGLDELWSGLFDLEVMQRESFATVPAVVLCHNPDGVDRPGWGDFQGWILAGHTHGGQCKPPFLPPPLLPVKNQRYTSGAFDLFDGRMLYINRGLGYQRQLRFNAPPEITVFRMTRPVS